MALADRRQAPDTRTPFEKWIDTLSEQNRKVVLGWLNDPSIPHAHVMDWIREDDPEDEFTGYSASRDTIAAWRRKNGISR